MTVEVWKPIKGFEGYYEISNEGRVKSLERVVPDGMGFNRKIKERLLKPGCDTPGYLFVILRKSGLNHKISIHREVAKHFIEACEGKNIVNHIDGNRLNNHFKNLEWTTQLENIQHAIKTGLHDQTGEKSRVGKLKQHQVDDIRYMYSRGNITQRELGKIYGVGQMTICKIVNNETWKG